MSTIPEIAAAGVEMLFSSLGVVAIAHHLVSTQDKVNQTAVITKTPTAGVPVLVLQKDSLSSFFGSTQDTDNRILIRGALGDFEGVLEVTIGTSVYKVVSHRRVQLSGQIYCYICDGNRV